MKMLWLLALICRDFPCIICSKKSDLLLALKMLWWWFARNRQQARGTLPPCLHCQTATGKQPPRVVSPPRYRRKWRIKKNSRWRVPGTGMLPSAAKVGLKLVWKPTFPAFSPGRRPTRKSDPAHVSPAFVSPPAAFRPGCAALHRLPGSPPSPPSRRAVTSEPPPPGSPPSRRAVTSPRRRVKVGRLLPPLLLVHHALLAAACSDPIGC